MKKGAFIVFEGTDGAGKTTQIKKLSQYLNRLNIPHICTREPGGTPYAEACRALFKKFSHLTREQQFHLVHSGRIDHIQNLIRPAIESGKTILCDRFVFSTYAYQNNTFGFYGWERYFNEVKDLGVWPDLTFIFSTDYDTYKQRMETKEIDHLEEITKEEFEDRSRFYEEAPLVIPSSYINISSTDSNEEAVYKTIKTTYDKNFGPFQ